MRKKWLSAGIIIFVAAVFQFHQKVLCNENAGIRNTNSSLGNERVLNDYIAIGWNDLGMHCMSRNFSHICILPPYNNVWVQVIQRGSFGVTPQKIQSGVMLSYSFVNNTYSIGKTDFWNYEDVLFGVNLAPNIGLTGNGLTGNLSVHESGWWVSGIPITPFEDTNWITEQAYQLMDIVLKTSGGVTLDTTQIVAPVSTEMHCDNCHHGTQGTEVAILALHDEENETNLVNSQPVLCANCHASNALGMSGNPDLPSLSEAIHGKHAEENPQPTCYQCHPGSQTACLRGIHYLNGLNCNSCHGTLFQVANTIEQGRRPWLDEPSCGTCHGSGHAPEAGKLYRDSKGHSGIYCEACHGSPHAIFPSREERDNRQSIRLQGHAGKIDDCRVCHGYTPMQPGPHGYAPVQPVPTLSTLGIILLVILFSVILFFI